MTFEDKDLEEFQTMYEEEFGEPISGQEASYIASRLVMLYEALARPLPSEKEQFTDSVDHAKLDVEVGADQAYPSPTSEKVVL
jgi:hypothetical protein